MEIVEISSRPTNSLRGDFMCGRILCWEGKNQQFPYNLYHVIQSKKNALWKHTYVVFVFPSFFYFYCLQKASKHRKNTQSVCFYYVFAHCSRFFGFLAFPCAQLSARLCAVLTLFKFIFVIKSSSQKYLIYCQNEKKKICLWKILLHILGTKIVR